MAVGEQSREGSSRPSRPVRLDRVWSIVLAGGDGVRMRRWILNHLGTERPKQFCTFTGTRSMLRHTLDRAARISTAHRTYTILGAGQRVYLEPAGCRVRSGRVLEQPRNRGTLAATFVALAHLLERDPDALAVILPSDHYISPEWRFIESVREAALSAEVARDQILLFGASPDFPETEYGWIMPRRAHAIEEPSGKGNGPVAVATFREKPTRREAQFLLESGALWNTMVAVARAWTLWDLAQDAAPSTARAFREFRRFLQRGNGRGGDGAEGHELLRDLYEGIETCDFARDFLERVTDRTLVMPLRDVTWSDWGRPERIEQMLSARALIAAGRRADPASRVLPC
jgi:mannose-1-phosphate guanylyltransferase